MNGVLIIQWHLSWTEPCHNGNLPLVENFSNPGNLESWGFKFKVSVWNGSNLKREEFRTLAVPLLAGPIVFPLQLANSVLKPEEWLNIRLSLLGRYTVSCFIQSLTFPATCYFYLHVNTTTSFPLLFAAAATLYFQFSFEQSCQDYYYYYYYYYYYNIHTYKFIIVLPIFMVWSSYIRIYTPCQEYF